MRVFLRRIRGIFGTGLTWALPWGAFWGGVMALLGLDVSSILAVALMNGIGMFIAGSLFAVILSVVERHHRLEDLSLRRVALWAGLATLLVSGSFDLFFGHVNWWMTVPLILSTGGFGAGTVAIAKRAERKLIEGEEESVPRLEEGSEAERSG